jgi:hypothetical protein
MIRPILRSAFHRDLNPKPRLVSHWGRPAHSCNDDQLSGVRFAFASANRFSHDRPYLFMLASQRHAQNLSISRSGELKRFELVRKGRVYRQRTTQITVKTCSPIPER